MIPNKIEEKESLLLPSWTPQPLLPELLIRVAESLFAFLTQVHFFFFFNIVWKIFCSSEVPFSDSLLVFVSQAQNP